MAKLIVKTKNIALNIRKINDYLNKNGIVWTLVLKVLSGNRKILESLLGDSIVKNFHSFGDSRLSSLKTIKQINPELRTMLIKPPSVHSVSSVIKWADISVNTSLPTLHALDEEAQKQKKIHKVMIMIELGELREGVMREQLVKFYDEVFNLNNIEVIGLGTNLGCMYGIEPTYDKLIQLGIYRELLEAKFNRSLPLISGGSSITLPLIPQKKIPRAVNHFRIGEAIFFGVSPLENKKFLNLSTNTFEVEASIIEQYRKKLVPDGNTSDAGIGKTSSFSDEDYGTRQRRAIVDFGIIDADYSNLTPRDKKISFIGTTSDMTVYEVPEGKRYTVGNTVRFKPNYMATAQLLNSKFTKVIIT